MDLSNFKFVFIPKTGTTSLISQLEKFDPITFRFNDPHRTAMQFRALDPDYHKKFSFSVVRNPFQRLVSIWQYDLKLVLGTKNLRYKDYIDFNVWVEQQVTHTEWARYYTTMPQWYWLSDGFEIMVSKVFNFENYQNNITELSSIMDIKLDNRVTNESMKKYRYQDIASPETKRIMLDLYKPDCDRFNYDW